MRIAQVCPYSLTFPGGVQCQVLGLASALRRLGHEVKVLAPCDGPVPDADVVPLGLSIPFAANGSVAPVAPDPACFRRTVRRLEEGDFDLVHVHEPLVPGPSLTALLTTRLAVVGTFHRGGNSGAYRALRPLVRWVADRIDQRCAVSEDARASATAGLGGEYALVPNGVELDRFASADPWPTKGPTIMFLGRHEPRKGLATLLEAFDHLEPEARLWVAGSGPETAELMRKSARNSRIEWLGQISDAEKAARLRGADVYAAPSEHGESFGVVLLEAMAAGTPIVASDLRGYRLVARAGIDALLIAPGDAVSLAEGLARVLDNQIFAEKLAGAGRARAAEFSMQRAALSYVELYEQLLASGAGGASHLSRLRPDRLVPTRLKTIRLLRRHPEPGPSAASQPGAGPSAASQPGAGPSAASQPGAGPSAASQPEPGAEPGAEQ
ncbi:MAG: glycosyltransferase [Acidimicrobiales bacterium]